MAVTVPEAVQCLADAMRRDPEFAWSWHCALSCAAMDEGLGHEAADRAASRFMRMAFEADYEKYQPGRWVPAAPEPGPKATSL